MKLLSREIAQRASIFHLGPDRDKQSAFNRGVNPCPQKNRIVHGFARKRRIKIRQAFPGSAFTVTVLLEPSNPWILEPATDLASHRVAESTQRPGFRGLRPNNRKKYRSIFSFDFPLRNQIPQRLCSQPIGPCILPVKVRLR